MLKRYLGITLLSGNQSADRKTQERRRHIIALLEVMGLLKGFVLASQKPYTVLNMLLLDGKCQWASGKSEASH